MTISQNPVHLWPVEPQNHRNLPNRKPPSTHRSQIPQSKTGPFTAHHRADMPHLKHQSVPTDQLTCKACGKFYIGSTTRFLHHRVKEQLTNDNSSVKKHLITYHHNHQTIEAKIITRENDPADLRLYEAFYIKNTSRNWTPVRNVLTSETNYFN